VPAVTASMISDKISIDFVHEGTGKLIFPRQYSRELVDRVCKEASFDRMGMGYGDAGQSSGFSGMGKYERWHPPVHKHRRCGPAADHPPPGQNAVPGKPERAGEWARADGFSITIVGVSADMFREALALRWISTGAPARMKGRRAKPLRAKAAARSPRRRCRSQEDRVWPEYCKSALPTG
jgi:hypothetical protein